MILTEDPPELGMKEESGSCRDGDVLSWYDSNEALVDRDESRRSCTAFFLVESIVFCNKSRAWADALATGEENVSIPCLRLSANRLRSDAPRRWVLLSSPDVVSTSSGLLCLLEGTGSPWLATRGKFAGALAVSSLVLAGVSMAVVSWLPVGACLGFALAVSSLELAGVGLP